MPIVITNPVEVDISFKKGSKFTIEEIFNLAQAIDEYEIEKEVSATLVVDIMNISSHGESRLLMTPKANITYDQLSQHLRGILNHIIQKEQFSDIDLELGNINFLTKHPGMPSEFEKEVESLRKIKENMMSTEVEARHTLDQSRKILDEIMRLQTKPEEK